mgnify:CR=1 FL=1
MKETLLYSEFMYETACNLRKAENGDWEVVFDENGDQTLEICIGETPGQPPKLVSITVLKG